GSRCVMSVIEHHNNPNRCHQRKCAFAFARHRFSPIFICSFFRPLRPIPPQLPTSQKLPEKGVCKDIHPAEMKRSRDGWSFIYPLPFPSKCFHFHHRFFILKTATRTLINPRNVHTRIFWRHFQ